VDSYFGFLLTFVILDLWLGSHLNTCSFYGVHADHHKDHDSWFERNDAFFIFFIASEASVYFIMAKTFLSRFQSVTGIFAYGLAYFVVRDIFIRNVLKCFVMWLLRKGVRQAHKMHHKHIGRRRRQMLQMLFVPFKYLKIVLETIGFAHFL
jgi:beta-carotene 3-hydroxylase